MTITLILGSGPNVIACRDWPRAPFDRIIAINNAWQVRPDWDDLICPDDFPAARQPVTLGDRQSIIRSETYVPAQNSFGGFVYAGGTMAFTAGYWALAALRPRVIAYLGCDMVYTPRDSHFYGTGTADPLRRDVTLRSLEAKSARLMIHAARQGCAVVNLSRDESRLVLPRAAPQGAASLRPQAFDTALAAEADATEAQLGYTVPSGKYWKEESRFAIAQIDALDALWLKAARLP